LSVWETQRDAKASVTLWYTTKDKFHRSFLCGKRTALQHKLRSHGRGTSRHPGVPDHCAVLPAVRRACTLCSGADCIGHAAGACASPLGAYAGGERGGSRNGEDTARSAGGFDEREIRIRAHESSGRAWQSASCHGLRALARSGDRTWIFTGLARIQRAAHTPQQRGEQFSHTHTHVESHTPSRFHTQQALTHSRT